MAKSFATHQIAREFTTTCAEDYPVIVQFAASSPNELASAAEHLIGAPIDGIE